MDSVLERTRLAVVQPSTHFAFQRRAIDALGELVPFEAAFFYLDIDDARAYDEGVRFARGAFRQVRSSETLTLSAAFGFDRRSVVEAQVRAYRGTALYDEDARARLPFFRDHASDLGLPHAALLFLHEGGVLFGLCGIERSSGEFSDEEMARLEALGPFLVTGARAQLAYDDLSREAACLRALANKRGSLYVVDRDRKRVIWAANRGRGIDWKEDVLANEAAIVNALEAAFEAKGRHDALPTPPRIGIETVQGTAKLETEPAFGRGRIAVLSTEAPDDGSPTLLQSLSKREREIARLLVAGYSGVNVAAIAGLSENTVRTYVRRLYGKLDVVNRADLVRKLMAPAPRSQSPGSQLAPPPDSSLAYGDDTLD